MASTGGSKNFFQSKMKGGKKKKNWIKGAIKHPGAEKAAAKKAGKSTHQFMEEEKNAPGKAGKRARLGLALEKMGKGRRKKK